MSREIDFSKPLSDEDVQYLVDRGRLNELPDNAEAPRAPAPPSALVTPASSPGNDGADEEGDDEYDDWTVDELKDELDKRELPVSGRKTELVARLREHDATAEPSA